MNVNADNDTGSVSTKEAVILSLNEFQRYFGELPSMFELSVENKSNNIKVMLILVPYREGGDLTVIIDKKTGKTIKVIKGQ